MNIEINGCEYQCWHEVGHAAICIEMGYDVEFIQLLDEESPEGIARARCERMPDRIRKHVLCAGFATEFVLYRSKYLSAIDEEKFIQILFKNATIDREMYFDKNQDQEFTKNEDQEFMDFAINNVVPIICKNLSSMKRVVSKLQCSKKIDGKEIKKLLNEI